MKTKVTILATTLFMLIWTTACNMPNGTPHPAVQTATAQAQQSPPTPGTNTDDHEAPSISNVTISDQVVYFGNSGCNPQVFTLSATVTDNGDKEVVAFLFIDGERLVPVLTDFGKIMSDNGNNIYRLSFSKNDIASYAPIINSPNQKHTMEFFVHAEDAYHNSSSLGFGGGHTWDGYAESKISTPPDFPKVRLVPCVGPTPAPITMITSQPQVIIPTQTPPPVFDPPTSIPPTEAPPAITSSYVELYDYEGVDLDNSGGSNEMFFGAYDPNTPNPGHNIGQQGGGGTVWAATSNPSYENCMAITSWQTATFIALGETYCYQTDQYNYGYLRIDRLEQVGTGEISPWVLGIPFSTWLP